jgi:hypothetical protein
VTAATPGSFGDLLGPKLPELAALDKEFQAADCLPIMEGKRAWAEAPESCKVALEKGTAVMSAALLATHAKEATPPPALSAIRRKVHELHHGSEVHQAMLSAAKLASLDIFRLAETKATEAALARCMDLLGLARDLTYGTGLRGADFGATVVHFAEPACTRALEVAPASARAEALTTLNAIQRGFAPLSVAFREDAALDSLLVQAVLASPESIGRLPPELQAQVKRSVELGNTLDKEDRARLEDVLPGWLSLQAWRGSTIDVGKMSQDERLRRDDEELQRSRAIGPALDLISVALAEGLPLLLVERNRLLDDAPVARESVTHVFEHLQAMTAK